MCRTWMKKCFDIGSSNFRPFWVLSSLAVYAVLVHCFIASPHITEVRLRSWYSSPLAQYSRSKYTFSSSWTNACSQAAIIPSSLGKPAFICPAMTASVKLQPTSWSDFQLMVHSAKHTDFFIDFILWTFNKKKDALSPKSAVGAVASKCLKRRSTFSCLRFCCTMISLSTWLRQGGRKSGNIALV